VIQLQEGHSNGNIVPRRAQTPENIEGFEALVAR
jgi:hypothetical protein